MSKGFVKLQIVATTHLILAVLLCINISICRADSQLKGEKTIEPWRFVVFGDTRDSTQDTKTGISPFLGMLAGKIADEQPALVIHLGDSANGYYTHSSSPMHGKYKEMFANWKTAVKPIYDFDIRKGIPLYVIRGNHEDGELVTNTPLKAAYLEEIAPFMPTNGPKKEKGLTYSVKHNQATFIALDEYSIKEFGLLRGLVDLPWLNEQLERRTPFMFVFGHVPAYKVSDEKGGPFPDLYSFTKHRDAFWDSLKGAGVQMYFCGHVHFYCRVTKDGIQQVLIGNGGANLVDFNLKNVDPTVVVNFPTTDRRSPVGEISYVLFTVDEMAKTVHAVQKVWNEDKKTWEIGDKFTAYVSF